jgi:hypothetical protein
LHDDVEISYGVFMIATKNGYRKWIVFLQKMLDYVPGGITTIWLHLRRTRVRS